MKKLTVLLVTIPFIAGLSGCNNNPSGTEGDELIIVDVTKTYSDRKEIILQDFMDVEYIPLETNEDFINQGWVLAVGDETILVRNLNDDGDIFVYDRTGKALRKFNRKGSGGEEYVYASSVVLDEDKGEMFINDISQKKILVYDLYGNFKRSFKHNPNNQDLYYTDMFNFDKDHLICYDPENEDYSLFIVSKLDGSFTHEINVPFTEKYHLRQVLYNDDGEPEVTFSPGGGYYNLIPFKGDWMLIEFSTDTIFALSDNYKLRPLMVRTPSIKSMDPQVMLVLRFFTDRHYFMETIKNEIDFETSRGFPRTFMAYDREEKQFIGYIIFNGDYSIKKEMYMNYLRPVGHEIESWQRIEAYQLVESYENGELKGQLKEIAAELNEEDNPVIMLVKHRK